MMVAGDGGNLLLLMDVIIVVLVSMDVNTM